ncbi:MAG TPA: hypothetical protein VND93_30165 [Myxococcales bacterium]|nr:hypothetical protein [Myxococcales bacterium]
MPAAAFALTVSFLLAAPAREPLKLAAPGFSAVDVSEAQATFFSDHFAQQLNLRGLQVTTSSQIGAVLGFERQRQLLGCKESSSSCMAELAAALGVDGVVTGSVGKFDQTYQVNISIVSTRDGRTLSAFSRKVNGSSAVLDALNDAASQMARDLGRPPLPAPQQPMARPTSPSGGLRDWFWLPGGAGVAAGAGATAFLLLAKEKADQLQLAAQEPTTHQLTLDQAQQLQSAGRTYSTVGYVLTAAGVIGLGAGAYFLLGTGTGPSQPVSMRITPGPTGLVVSGVFR